MDVGLMTTFFVSLDSAGIVAVLTLEVGEAKTARVPLEEEEERPNSNGELLVQPRWWWRTMETVD
jgi:hypothetical protein